MKRIVAVIVLAVFVVGMVYAIAVAEPAQAPEGRAVVPKSELLTSFDADARAAIAAEASRTQERQDIRWREERRDRREARQERAAEVAAEDDWTPAGESYDHDQVQPGTGGCSGLPADLANVCQHESGGNPHAYNPSGCVGGCYGLFQMAGEYMGTWAARAGYPDYNWAGFWPVEVQKAVALHMYNQPNGLYVYWCQWTTYC